MYKILQKHSHNYLIRYKRGQNVYNFTTILKKILMFSLYQHIRRKYLIPSSWYDLKWKKHRTTRKAFKHPNLHYTRSNTNTVIIFTEGRCTVNNPSSTVISNIIVWYYPKCCLRTIHEVIKQRNISASPSYSMSLYNHIANTKKLQQIVITRDINQTLIIINSTT